jgi:hypothetical protein
MPRRPRGTGCLYRRGSVWWLQYTDHGAPRYESSKSTDRAEAERQLQIRLGDLAAGRDIPAGKATMDDLYQLVLADYRIRRLRDVEHVTWRYGAEMI